MINICERSICTGCMACVNKCPIHCIDMQVGDSLGHLYPIIDQSKCIDCGACVKVCPSINLVEKRLAPFAYAGWDKDENEYITSTSGGAASALSRIIIDRGGVVYGCAMLPNIDCRHIRVENIPDLNKLKGSKYVQSFIGNSYISMLNDLKEGRRVLFIGTPCQVAGALRMAGKHNDKLITVDLVCHGVPSLSFLKKHIKKVTKGLIPDEIYFRKGSYLLLLLLCGREIYRNDLFKQRYKDTYYNTFFDGYSYRKSCHTCLYACPERISDITIGDFWGLKDDLPIEHPHGCSVLLPNTEKGLKLIESIDHDFFLFKRDISEAINGNDQLRSPKTENKRIRLFKKICPILGIRFSYRLCVCDKITMMFLRRIKSKLKTIITCI